MSIYDAVNTYLAEHTYGARLPNPRGQDCAKPYVKNVAVFECWKDIYEDRTKALELFQLGEKLIDLEDAVRRWRFHHLGAVSRIIGNETTGTGGSSGLRYLRGVANNLYKAPIFPELWGVRNYMFDPTHFDIARAGYV